MRNAVSCTRLLLAAIVFALTAGSVAAPAASAASTFPLVAATVPTYTANHYAFDLVIHSRHWNPAAAKAANPRAVWLMNGMGGATYGQIIVGASGFNSSRCLLRHADGSAWSGVKPFNMTLPDCTDFIANTVAASARSFGLYSQPWDGVYQDSLSYHPYQYAVRTAGGLTNVDANLDGKADTQAALESSWRTGMRRYTARLRTNLPGKIVLANGVDWGNTTDLDTVDGNMKEHSVDHILARQNGTTIKTLVDMANRWYAVSNGRARLYATVSYWKSSLSALPTNARQLMQADPDAQRRMRFGLATSLMAGIHYDFQYSRTPGSSAVYDEYRGGDLNRQGYLGAPTGAAREVSVGVWRRDFQNGVALANENGFAVNVNVSGQKLRRLKGTQNTSVNSGAVAGLVTLPALDGIILRRDGTVTPPPPPSAPTVGFVGVSAGQTLTGTVNWQAATTAGGGTISKVEFSVDGVVRSTDLTAPYQYAGTGSWDTKQVADGNHTLGLKLTLADGRTAQATLQVTVRNTVAPPPPPPTTLAPNPSFESDPATAYTTHGPGTFQWASGVAHTGQRSLSIVGSSAGLTRWLSRTSAIRAVPGKAYNVSAWFRTSGVLPTAGARLAVTFFNAGGTYIAGSALESASISGTRDWGQLTRNLVAPPTTAYLRVEFRLGGAGTLWVDDVAVTAS